METSIVWPATLPNPVYPMKRVREDTVLRSSFEAGYEQTRNRFTRKRPGWSLQWPKMKQDDYDVLVAFFEDTTDNGALSFNWTNPHSNETAEYRFVKPIEDSLVDFNLWSVSAEIRRV